jgi:hypothetical protein
LIYVTAVHGGRKLLAIRPDAVGYLRPAKRSAPKPDEITWLNERQGSYIPTPIVYKSILHVPNAQMHPPSTERLTGPIGRSIVSTL